MIYDFIHIRIVESQLDFCTVHDLAVHLEVPELAVNAVLTGQVRTVRKKHLEVISQDECRARKYHS